MGHSIGQGLKSGEKRRKSCSGVLRYLFRCYLNRETRLHLCA